VLYNFGRCVPLSDIEILTLKIYNAFRLNWMLVLMDRGIYQRDVLPKSGTGSVADIVASRDWNVSLVR